MLYVNVVPVHALLTPTILGVGAALTLTGNCTVVEQLVPAVSVTLTRFEPALVHVTLMLVPLPVNVPPCTLHAYVEVPLTGVTAYALVCPVQLTVLPVMLGLGFS